MALILVVEHDDDIRSNIVRLLKLEGRRPPETSPGELSTD